MIRTTLAALPLLTCAASAAASTHLASLADLSLEQLSNVVVTSVSRRDEPLSRAAASIYVITAEEIRRSGRASLPELLRLAPNLDVARADANQYAISARGFNNTLANKLLVLTDGRTVYTPLFSGTFWEAQDAMLEDIERIEVISGPGATLWGANAVNGVINIITKSAAETQGVGAVLQAGTQRNDAAARYGGEIAGGHFRLYGKTVRRDNTALANGSPILDRGEQVQGGFRADWGRAGHGFTLQGDAYEGEVREQARDYSGMNLLGRLTRDLGEGAEVKAQAYFDRTLRNHFGLFKEELDTLDFELQHGLAPAGAHRMLWGLGLRQHDDRVVNSPLIVFQPASLKLERHHLFLQDEIALSPELAFTVGGKLDYNSYTGNEFLPSARIGWRPAQSQLLWAALSRAARAPSRVVRDLFFPLNPVPLLGGPGFRSEVAKVAELGWRAQPTRVLSYSLTAFYADYDHIRTVAPVPGGSVVANDRFGTVHGVEGWGTWRVSRSARLSAGFVMQEVELRDRAGTVNLAPASEGNDPPYWWKLRAAFDLTDKHELDVFLRHYAARPAPEVPAYTAVDARLAWRAAKDLELSLAVQNLFERRHPEWGAAASRAELERAAFVKLRVGL